MALSLVSKRLRTRLQGCLRWANFSTAAALPPLSAGLEATSSTGALAPPPASPKAPSELSLNALADDVDRLEALAEIGTWSWDLAAAVLRLSPGACRLLELPTSSETPAHATVQSRVHPDDLAHLSGILTAALASGSDPSRTFAAEHRLCLPSGQLRHVRLRFTIQHSSAGRPVRLFGTMQDWTAPHEQAVRLVDAKNAADAASRTKSTFLANMSHEIRTPMTSVLGFAELLATSPDLAAAKRDSYVQTIARNGRHLLSLIDDILDLSKIEAGHLLVQAIRFAPVAEITQALDLLRPQAEKKQLSLTVSYDDDLPTTIVSDPTRFRQILLNIVGNAVKFTDKGYVRIAARRLPQPNLLEITVTDSGCGVTPAFRSQLFQPFVQADSRPSSRRTRGSGLGLALARELARAMGGDIVLSDPPDGAGSRFVITIGMALVSAAPAGVITLDGGFALTLAPDPPETSGSGEQRLGGIPIGLRVLVAEDNADIQEILQRLLEAIGAHVAVVGNGALAVEAAAATAYDLVIMDMQMPVLDGFGATAQLRSAGFVRPIIALTAFAMNNERQRCLAAGCSAFLAKPVEALTLIRTIGHCLKAPAVNGASRSLASP